MKTKAYCPDCGPATVPHWIERASARMDAALGYLVFLNRIGQWAHPLAVKMRPGRIAPTLASALTAAGLGKTITEPDEKTNWRARVLWEEAAKRGIVMKEFRLFGLPRELFFANYRGDTIVFDGVPRPRGAHGRSLLWMDDKGIIIEKFRKAGIPVPVGKTCTSVAQAEAVFKEVRGPVIVKPNLGSRSRHTYVHLTDLPALRSAFKKAQQLSPYVVVEEELEGFVFRISLVGYRVAGIMRREPSHVVGDGVHTVRELVATENKDPLRHGPIFHELPLDEEVVAELKEAHMTLDSIPPAGDMVVLHKKVSRAYGASTTEMTDVHPDNQALFLKIAKVLDDPLVGVDFIMKDMARSWREQKCGIIECNSLPFIDLHHYPLKGPARNVAGDVWDMIFPGSSRS
jgi:D-alanine-D-alanine ligase-like ATP-grasp enzyme